MPATRQSPRPTPQARGRTMAERADRHRLYERSVQDAEAELDFVDDTFRALRGRAATRLREDFCGTGCVAAHWTQRRRANVAIGVDLDPEVLAWGREHHLRRLLPAQQARVTLRQGDVMSTRTPAQDIVLAMNFSYWIFKARAALRAYFETVRRTLVADGVFFLDVFGGSDAFRVLQEKRDLRGFTYVWDQAAYNPVTADLRCHIHFRFPDGSRLQEAFTYEWRLWTLPEIRELLAEAGFKRSIVYWQGWDDELQDATGEFTAVETAEPDAGWIAYLAALK
jgi:SAM-dependent methyltransferase